MERVGLVAFGEGGVKVKVLMASGARKSAGVHPL